LNSPETRGTFKYVEGAHTRQLGRYLVEVNRPALGFAELETLTARARAAAAELREAGTEVRFLRAVFVPEDETCFFLYESESPEAVRQAASVTGVALGGVTDSMEL
jgi:hypothetical protein